MARRVYFGFDYEDVADFRANVVRNHWRTKEHREAAGFFDASLWETTVSQGDLAIKRLINNGLRATSVTCILVGSETYLRPWVRYEMLKSYKKGSDLLSVHIKSIQIGSTTDFVPPQSRAFLLAPRRICGLGCGTKCSKATRREAIFFQYISNRYRSDQQRTSCHLSHVHSCWLRDVSAALGAVRNAQKLQEGKRSSFSTYQIDTDRINNGLRATSVTCILVGSETYLRPWVRYEMLKSYKKGSDLLSVHIKSIQIGSTTDFVPPQSRAFLLAPRRICGLGCGTKCSKATRREAIFFQYISNRY